MDRHLIGFAAVALAAALAVPASTMAQRADRTKVGTLTCDISARHRRHHRIKKKPDLHVHAVASRPA